jgi:hypothetical protein
MVDMAFMAKPNAQSMSAQESSLHTYRTENGYRITNVTIYNIYYQIVSYKRLSGTLDSITAKRHHNSTGNQPGQSLA